MSSNSSAWEVYLPDNLSLFNRMAKLDYGDMSDISDGTGGTLNTVQYRESETGRIAEVYRYRNAAPNTFGVSVPEEAAEFLEALRDNDCVFAIQRRKNDGTVKHYNRVQINTKTTITPSSSGINARDAVTLVTLPMTFQRQYNFSDCNATTFTNPILRDTEGEPIEELDIMDIAYCDSRTCCPYSDGCEHMFILAMDDLGESYLFHSSDNGANWEQIPLSFSSSLPITKRRIFCINGRMFLGIDEDLYYSDDPTSGIFTVSDVSGIPDFVVGQNQATVKIANLGTTLYILYTSNTLLPRRKGFIAESIDMGITWTRLFALPEELDISKYWRDLSVAGNNLIVVGDDGLAYISSDSGLTWTLTPIVSSGMSRIPPQSEVQTITSNLLATSMWNPDFRNLSCNITMIVDSNGQLFVSENGAQFTKIYDRCKINKTAVFAKIGVGADGWLVWVYIDFNGTALIIKNTGDSCWREQIINYGTNGYISPILDCNDDRPDAVIIVPQDRFCIDLNAVDPVMTVLFNDMTTSNCDILSHTVDPINGTIIITINNVGCGYTSTQFCDKIPIAVADCGEGFAQSAFDWCRSDPDKAFSIANEYIIPLI